MISSSRIPNPQYNNSCTLNCPPPLVICHPAAFPILNTKLFPNYPPPLDPSNSSPSRTHCFPLWNLCTVTAIFVCRAFMICHTAYSHSHPFFQHVCLPNNPSHIPAAQPFSSSKQTLTIFSLTPHSLSVTQPSRIACAHDTMGPSYNSPSPSLTAPPSWCVVQPTRTSATVPMLVRDLCKRTVQPIRSCVFKDALTLF